MTTGRELHLLLPIGGTQPLRLLDVIPPLDVPLGPERWLQGVTWEPWQYRGLTVDNEETCVLSTFDVVPTTCEAWLSQAPFRLSDAIEGANLTYALEEAQGTLTARYNMTISAAFASELLSGAGSADRSLSSVATAPVRAAFGSGATPVWDALAILESEIAGRLFGGVGLIHIPPGLLAQAILTYGISRGPSGAWETPAGNIVISDAGYVDPPAPTGQAASTATQDWIYCSGPIWFGSSVPHFIGAGSETMSLSTNTYTTFVAGYGILVFDTDPVSAVLASYDVNA